MIDGLDADVVGADSAAERRDEVATQVREHAGRVARELSLLRGGDYGQATFDTDRGTWTLKYEGGDVQYLRFERGGRETYVVSDKQQPAPEALATALTDYAAFVAAFNDHVRSLDGVLADAPTEFPEIVSTDAVVAERERVLSRIRECANTMASELHRYEGTNYGTFSTRVDRSRWELKWEDGQASYLRVGGEGGVYLLSQYEPPSVGDLETYAGSFRGFVDAFNDHVTEITETASTISL